MIERRRQTAAKKPDWDDTESSWMFELQDITEFDDGDMDADEFAEWRLLSGDARRLQARRAIESATEELALRRELEDFPND